MLRWFGADQRFNEDGVPYVPNQCVPKWVLHRKKIGETEDGTPLYRSYATSELLPAPKFIPPPGTRNDYRTDNALRRIMLCALAGYGEGADFPVTFRRQPIFHGSDFKEVYPIGSFDKEGNDTGIGWSSVTTAVDFFYKIYTGDFRSPFWETAWYLAYVTEVNPNVWRLTVFYRGRDEQEGSDAEEIQTDEDGNPDIREQLSFPEDNPIAFDNTQGQATETEKARPFIND